MENKFSDHEGEVTSFARTSSNSRATNSISTSTIEIISSDQCTQTTSKQNIAVQTNEENKSDQPDYNEEALLEFMRNCAPRVEEELRKRNKYFNVDYKQNWSDEEEFFSKKLNELRKHKNTEKTRVKHICWSSHGNKIAVSLSHIKHDTWCTHEAYVLIYECDKNDKFNNEAKECILVNTCLMDIKFHPSINSLLVFGTEEGKIYLYNTSEKLKYNSKNYIRHKSNVITQINWINLNSLIYLVVADSDGLMHLWTTSSNIEEWKLLKKFTFKTVEDTKERGVQCFAYSVFNPQNFVVALEGGVLFRCSMLTAIPSTGDVNVFNPVISKFEHSCLIVNCICFSLFEENLFLTSSMIDGRIRVYNMNERSPMSIIATEELCVGLEWNHVQDNIFKMWTTDGEIHYYDYRRCRLIKYFKIGEGSCLVSSRVKGMKQLLAVSDSNCDIAIWQTSLIIK